MARDNKTQSRRTRSNSSSRSAQSKVTREQPRKDSKSKRINLDNERVSKFDKDNDLASGKQPRTSAANDFSWYNHNPDLIAGAARLPNGFIAGDPIPGFLAKSSTPAVMRLVVNPIYATTESSVMTQAMNDQYSFVVHANSRNYNYAPVDMYLMELAGLEVFAAIGMGMRVYGIMQDFTAANRALPEVLIKAAGFDYADLLQNYSHMWFDLNRLISAAKQVWIPTTFSLTNRRFWMNTKIFMDSESVKDQYYMFVQQGFYQLQLTNRKGTSLRLIDWLSYSYSTSSSGSDFMTTSFVGDYQTLGKSTNCVTVYKKWSEYLQFVQSLIEPITNSQDRGMIYGDLLNAYGANNIFALNPIDLNYKTEIAYEPEVLTEIMNATLSPFKPYVLSQDPNTGGFTTEWAFADAHATSNPGTQLMMFPVTTPIINLKHSAVATPELLTVATRLMTLGFTGKLISTGSLSTITYFGRVVNYKPINVISSDSKPGTFGTEIVNAVDILGLANFATNTSDTEMCLVILSLRNGYYYGSTSAQALQPSNGGLVNVIPGWLRAFDWRPTRYIGVSGGSAAAYSADDIRTNFLYRGDASFYSPVYPEGELEDILPVSYENVRQLNDVCFQSMLGVPISLSSPRAKSRSDK